MLSPADLVEMAEDFAARIPSDPAYDEERDTSWQLIGEAYLRLNDPESARRTLTRFRDVEFEAELRCTFAQWTAEHPESDSGRAVLRETIAELDRLDPRLSDADYERLLPIVHALLGEEAVSRVGTFLQEPAEIDVAGFLQRAEAAIVDATAPPLRGPESLATELRRYLGYSQNDLKVRWLAQQAIAGGLDDSEAEQLLASEDFQRIERARQPSLYQDPSRLSDRQFVAFFFDRPIRKDPRDERFLEGRSFHFTQPDETRIVELATRLFVDFPTAIAGYKAAQIDQGLWKILGRLEMILPHATVPESIRRSCVEAMVHPFRDYLRKKPRYPGSAFFMWWDLIRLDESPLKPDGIAALKQILGMPGWPCQQAALHGLNHMRPDPEASRLIADYLAANSTRLKPKDREWVELCRDGRAL